MSQGRYAPSSEESRRARNAANIFRAGLLYHSLFARSIPSAGELGAESQYTCQQSQRHPDKPRPVKPTESSTLSRSRPRVPTVRIARHDRSTRNKRIIHYGRDQETARQPYEPASWKRPGAGLQWARQSSVKKRCVRSYVNSCPACKAPWAAHWPPGSQAP